MVSHWYVVYTKPRQEALACEHLERQGFGTFFPRVRLAKRRAAGMAELIEPMFPRYLFVQLESGVHDFSKVRSTRGCVDLVKFGGKASLMPLEMLDGLNAQLDEEGVLDLRKTGPKLVVGQTMRVEEGPFEGLMGQILQLKGQDRVLMLMNILGNQTRVELKKHQISQN